MEKKNKENEGKMIKKKSHIKTFENSKLLLKIVYIL